ncbi:MAG: hypothetical protein JST00_15900 [Deltaproteobacteria bacterium]|nr:hypothetical protein [Deltaproteobacteria bacterium]
MNRPISVASAVSALALVLAPSVASADPAAAQSLFYEARALMAKGQWAEACPKLEESNRLDPGIGTQFNLADCNEHVGKTATAWAGFLDVAAQAKAANQGEREKVARRRAQALEAKLPKLVVEVPSPLPGLEIKRDGTLVGGATYGTAIPIDPGAHKIVATAPGKQPWETQVQATEGKTTRVSIPRELPNAIVAAAPAPAPNAPPPSPAPLPPASGVTSSSFTTTESFPPPVTEERGTTQRTLGWIVAGLGAAGLGVGGAFGISSMSNRDEARQYCTGDLCNAQGVSLRDDAIRDGNVATVTMIAGGAALAGGLLLVLTAGHGASKEESTSRLRAAPSVAQNGGGLSIQGAFR